MKIDIFYQPLCLEQTHKWIKIIIRIVIEFELWNLI